MAHASNLLCFLARFRCLALWVEKWLENFEKGFKVFIPLAYGPRSCPENDCPRSCPEN
jgi:hypothetical protein